jgi:monoamine oxidase
MMIFADGIVYPASGIKVIIVGAGFAGLSLGIECVRNGHQVEIFEAAPEFRMLGNPPN